MSHRLTGRVAADPLEWGRQIFRGIRRPIAGGPPVLRGGAIRLRRQAAGAMRRLAMLALVAAGPAWPMAAHAATSTECPSPQTMTVASGGTATVDLSGCSVFGLDGVSVEPSHGSLPNVDPVVGNASGLVTYVNNGDGALSDTFVVLDDSSGTITFNVTVQAPVSAITVSPASLPTPVIGTAYSETLSATGGVAPYTYSATGVPPGLTLSPGGVISGTPTGFGSFVMSVSATDSTTPTALTATKNYSFTIAQPVLSVATPPNATVGLAYSQQLVVSGGTPPYYNYALSSGALPAGLSLSGSGLITGTPTTAGSDTFQISVFDSSSGIAPYFAILSVTLTVDPAPTITLSPASLGPLTVGAAYSQTITPSGGTAPYAFSVSAGALPAGLALNASTGVLSGTPTAGGAYNFTVGVHDSGAGTGSQAYSVTVQAPTIALTPATLTAATQGTAYNASLAASGGTAPYSFGVSAGALPAGLSLSSGGALSGTPTVSGSFTFTVTATDSSTGAGAPFTATRSYTLTVNAAVPVISPTSLPAGSAGVAYSQGISASGGTAPYTFVVSAGSLPAGLTLSSSGSLSGTPTAAGSFAFTVQVTDAASTTATQAYTLTIAAPTVTLSPATLPAATAESAYSQGIGASGGTAPYSFGVSAGALPAGLTLSSGGALSGTPTVSGSFTFSVTATDSSTGAGAPFTATRSYTLQVNAPSIALNPASLPNPQAGAAYSQQLAASGGTGSYAFAVTAGSLPTGLSLSAGGLLAGTPATAASFSFTVTATDSLHFSGSQAYTATVGQPRPVAVDDAAATAANAAVTVAVTANDSGPIASIAIVHAPAHGTASISGLDVVYTPASNYFGSDTLTYTASGPGGTSAAAAVSITVTPLAVPTAVAQTASVLAGKPVTIDAAAGASGGPFTGVAIVTPPGAGTLAISGTDMVFTPAATASGHVVFSYSLSNAFGTSAPATVTVTVNPLPVAVSRSVNAIAGVPLQVDLTGGASGGPFTAATLVSMTPANLGTASITPANGGYQLDFTPSASAGGDVVVSFTLANAYATSTAGTVTISIAPRSDPSKDAQVLGLLGAQAEAMRRFASGQINNFQQRLETMHGDGIGGGRFDNGISLVPSFIRQPGYGLAANDRNRLNGPDANWRYLVEPSQDAPSPAAVVPGLPSNMAVWTQGAIDFGTRDPRAGNSGSGFDFHTSGLSAGADYRVNPSFAFGAGIGYGHDNSSIGHNGSRSKADSYSLAFYASFHPGAATYIDGLAGYQTISFDSHRFVTESGGYLDGHRHASQFFASLSGGYDYRHGRFHLNPYGRIDSASGTLDGYTEKGDSIYVLSYRRETVNTTTGSFGLRIDYQDTVSMGMLVPQLRLEYQHDFQGATSATLGYADLLSGPLPRASIVGLNQNRLLLGIGASMQTWKGLALRFEYQRQFGTSGETDQSVLLNLQKRF
ncbi:MAG: putative Ig domain-containing protein [Xanthomonadaceae bacterium]|nr:putative Ig domain-containing protein [Xanthomonadaceae bacterium]